MDEELRRKLKGALEFLRDPIIQDDGLLFGVDFNSFPEEMSSLKISFHGKDPLTGSDIEWPPLVFNSSGSKTIQCEHWGDLWLSFEVTLRNGRKEANLVPNRCYRISNEGRAPKISYTLTDAKEFTRLCIYSNCWKRLCGNLFLSYDGSYHTVSPDSGEYVVYLPTTADNVELIVGQKLPTPTREETKKRGLFNGIFLRKMQKKT